MIKVFPKKTSFLAKFGPCQIFTKCFFCLRPQKSLGGLSQIVVLPGVEVGLLHDPDHALCKIS